MITIDPTVPPQTAAAMASDLLRQHGGRALGRARMQLYGAVNERDTAAVRLLTEVCIILMRETREDDRRSA